MDVDSLGPVLLLGSAVLLVAIVAVRLSARSGLPSLLIYLGIGLLLGESGLGIRFGDAGLTTVLGYAALVIILTEGGLTTRWDTIRPVIGPAAVLATVGTCISILVTGLAAHWLLHLDVRSGLLLGAIVSSTDAAAVFSVLRSVPLPARLVGLLEAESGFNDAPAVIAVVVLTELIDGRAHGPVWLPLVEGVGELLVGAFLGIALGTLGVIGLRRIALPSSGLYPIAVMALAVGAFGAAASLHGSGFLATYLCSLMLGNARLPHGATVRGFAEGAGWMAQIGLFVLLGLLASPSRLPAQVLGAAGVGLALLLVARPISLALTVSWFRVGPREQAFLSWAGLRGAVPIVLAAIPLDHAVPGSERIFDLVFVLVVLFTAVQGPTLPLVARTLRVDAQVSAVDLDVESSPLGALDADVVHVHVGPTSRLHGVEVFELRLPATANITLVMRDGGAFVPVPRTSLRHGDDLILVAAADVRRAVEDRLRDVSAHGRLAGWSTRSASARPEPPGQVLLRRVSPRVIRTGRATDNPSGQDGPTGRDDPRGREGPSGREGPRGRDAPRRRDA